MFHLAEDPYEQVGVMKDVFGGGTGEWCSTLS